VVGVWVESGGGGSGWADWWPVDAGHKNIAWYQAKIQNTGLPTNIRLHVGCGGSSADWWSDNRTGSTSRAGGALTGSAQLNAVCNEGTVPPPPGDNQRCWFGYASAVAVWAIHHLSGAGAYHAIRGFDLVTDDSAYSSWAGLCLAFAASAYENALPDGAWPSPTVSGPTATAKGMYNLYEADGLVHSASIVPPVGAFAFYPGLTADGHIGISIGNGQIVSATTGSPSVVPGGYSLNGQYRGWAYPTNAFR